MLLRPLLRLIIVLVLSVSTALTPAARAAGVEGGAQKSLQERVAKKIAQGTLDTTADVGRTMILIMVLTGAELVRQEYQKSHLKGKPVDSQHLEKLSFAAAKHLLTDGQFYMSVLGSGTMSVLGKKPLSILQALLANATSRRMLVSLVQSGIASFVTFTGWEAGAELWNQATLLIPDQIDFERSKNLLGVLAGAANGNAEDRRILGILLDNMGQILLDDDEMRAAWLYNTWRLHIATGQFVVLVGSMVSAGTVGTALFPGAGTLAGMMFGAVGGLVSMVVPEEIKEDMTDSLRFVRQSADRAQLRADRAQVKSWLEDGVSGNDIAGFRGFLDMQSTIRSNVMTVFSEADYKRRVAIQSLDHEIATARETLRRLKANPRDVAALYSESKDLGKTLRELVASHSGKIEKIKREIERIEAGMRDFYALETVAMMRLMRVASHSKSDVALIEYALNIEIDRLSDITRALSNVVAKGVDFQNPGLLSWIQVSHFRGFKEDRLKPPKP